MMKIILAMDSFKGCLSSEEVEEIFALALKAQGAEVVSVPMSDGGEGMLEAFIAALHGETVEASVHDPLMRPIRAHYGRTADGTAIIETAQACGLTLMSAAERNPLIATTYGVGELIAHAVKQGSRNFIIGLGGKRNERCRKGDASGSGRSLHQPSKNRRVAGKLSERMPLHTGQRCA